MTIFDDAGAQVGTACGSTWESAWKTGSFGGGTTPRAVNGFDFWSTTGPNGTVVGHLDNVTYEAVTLPDLTGTINECGGPTLLSADVTGGPIASYVWRNAANDVVGTNPTFNAPEGAYTLTVTNTLCETQTSAPFVVTGPPPVLLVTITGNNTVCCGQTTTLTANVVGMVTSYTWRDALENVVGTNSTFAAGPGTYTVTVTNACGSARSQPFTVTALATVPLPTMGEWALMMFAALLACVAVVRMR